MYQRDILTDTVFFSNEIKLLGQEKEDFDRVALELLNRDRDANVKGSTEAGYTDYPYDPPAGRYQMLKEEIKERLEK